MNEWEMIFLPTHVSADNEFSAKLHEMKHVSMTGEFHSKIGAIMKHVDP